MARSPLIYLAAFGIVGLVAATASASGPSGPNPKPGKPGGPTGPTGPQGCHSEWGNKPRWTKAQLRELAAKVGFPDPNIMAAIALAESAGDQDAVNNCPPREYSVGLWQINILGSKTLTKEMMVDPLQNAKEAFRRSNNGKTYRPWGAYTNGSYKKFL